MTKIIVISPNPKSFYTTSVCDLLVKSNFKIKAIIVKKFTIRRFNKEFSRDGIRLIKKIWKKLILRGSAYKSNEKDNVLYFRKKNNIQTKNVKEFLKYGTHIHFVDDINSIESEKLFKKYSPDLVVFTGGGIVKENIIKYSGRGIINCHMGILPLYRGMDVIEWPILLNDFDNIGVTLHFISKGVDTGDIIKIKKIGLEKNDTIKKIRIRFEPIMIQEMVNVVIDILKNKDYSTTKQEEMDGKQFFVMDQKLIEIAKIRLVNHLNKIS